MRGQTEVCPTHYREKLVDIATMYTNLLLSRHVLSAGISYWIDSL